MAPDRQHIRLRWNPVFIHILAWAIVFLFPLLFIERFESMRRVHEFSLIKFYIQPISIAVIFYINYLWLIDKVLFRKDGAVYPLQPAAHRGGQCGYLPGTPNDYSRRVFAPPAYPATSPAGTDAVAGLHYAGTDGGTERGYQDDAEVDCVGKGA